MSANARPASPSAVSQLTSYMLPPELGSLANLEKLYLGNNPLESVPIDILLQVCSLQVRLYPR